MFKIHSCEGNGQGSCRRCTQKKIWNRSWVCFLYKIDGIEGMYCRDCVQFIKDYLEAEHIILEDKDDE